MKISALYLSIVLSILICRVSFAQIEGYYKDVFMDGGVDLYSHTTFPAATSLNLSMEYIATNNSSIQSQVMIQNTNDENGYLLYPDGSPRFRTIFTNGGSATDHGNSLGTEGREKVKKFYYNGGSYTGSCAGMFITSISYKENGIWEPYYHIWPGRTKQAGLSSTYTGHFIPNDSPLLLYYQFGNDHYISNVYHNYGGYAREDIDFPNETEVLLRYDYEYNDMYLKPSCWAYKKNEQSGRVVVIGSHPENETSGERLDLMKAIILYALDGIGTASIKGTLSNGIPRIMNKSTSDNMPAYTKIGDKQFHHFSLVIPPNVENLTITLNGDEGQPLNLFVTKDSLAFRSNSIYSDISTNSNKTISINDLTDGNWYIGVECDTTITVTQESWGYSYSGNLAVLNGVSYSILASWSLTGIDDNKSLIQNFMLNQNYPNPFHDETTIFYSLRESGNVKLTVYDIFGREVATLVNQYQIAGDYNQKFIAQNLLSGNYIIRLNVGNSFSSKIMTIIN